MLMDRYSLLHKIGIYCGIAVFLLFMFAELASLVSFYMFFSVIIPSLFPEYRDVDENFNCAKSAGDETGDERVAGVVRGDRDCEDREIYSGHGQKIPFRRSQRQGRRKPRTHRARDAEDQREGGQQLEQFRCAVDSAQQQDFDEHTDQILGIHLVGLEVGEIMQGFAVAVQAQLTKTQLDQTIGIHPTVAEELVTMREPNRFVSVQ